VQRKESKKEYLRRILNVKRGDPGYEEMDTVIREFNTFMRILNYKKCEGTPAEDIFVDMHNKGLTVSSLVAKGRKLEDIIQEMEDILKKAYSFYDSVLEPRYKKIAFSSCHSISDIDVELCDRRRINSVVGRYSNPKEFLKRFDKQWKESNGYLAGTIHLVFSGEYDKKRPQLLRYNEFDKVVDEEIGFFKRHKDQYNKVDDEHKDFYYYGDNDNPYKNLYLYYLNAYMKQYYKFDLPDVTLNRFYSLKQFDGVSDKITLNKVYSLRDIAELHSMMSGLPGNKIYENMKKKFRKLKFIMPNKDTGKYTFTDAALPLATYEYYKKKNHVEIDHGIPFWSYDPLMVYVYAPILRAMIFRKEKELEAYIRYRKFIISEYEGLLSRVDDGFQSTFLDMLLESPMRLKYRYMGLDVTRLVDGEFPT